MVEKLVSDFIGEPNPSYNKEVEHIIKDDDSDLVYYDKNILTIVKPVISLYLPKVHS